MSIDDTSLVANLCELFAQIDVNGDGTMEWEEFTSFIVETGKTAREHEPNSIQMYHASSWEDTSKHNSVIEKVYYFEGVDKIVTCEHHSKILRIYNAHCDTIKTVSSGGVVLCADHLSEHGHYAVSSSDLQLTFYDDSTYRQIKSVPVPSSQICLSWSPTDNNGIGHAGTLFSAGVSGTIYAWDPSEQNVCIQRHHMGGPGKDGHLQNDSHEDMVLDLLMITSLESLTSASMDRKIRLWDVHSGKHKQMLDGHTKGVRSLAYSSDYRFLVSAGFDYDALVWNPYVEHLILRLHGHQASLCGVEIIPNTPQIITGDVEGVFKVWDIRNFSCMQTFTGESLHPSSFVSVTPHKRIVTSGRKFHIFDYEKLANPELTDDNPVFCALYNPTSMTFITAAGSDVKIWDAQTGSLIRVYRNLSNTDLTALCLDDRERKFITGDHHGRIIVYDYLNGADMKEFKYAENSGSGLSLRAHTGEVSNIVYCNQDKCVISVSWDLSICIHDEMDPEKGVLLRKIEHAHTSGSDITACSFSHTLSLIATGSSDFTLHIWDYEFARMEGSCVGHTSGITSVLFLDPYPGLLAADNNGNICVWACRPSCIKYKCVLRFTNSVEGRFDETSPVLVMAVQCYWNSVDIATKKLNDPIEKNSFNANIRKSSCSSRVGRGDKLNREKKKKKFKFESDQVIGYDLYTGDEKGQIKHWLLLNMLKKLEQKYPSFFPLQKPFECENPRRNLRMDAFEVTQYRPKFGFKHCNNTKKKSNMCDKNIRTFNETFYHISKPTLPASCVKLCRSWKAHSDAVYSLQLINEPPALLTSSFDRLVRIFNYQGDLLGTLRQGEEYCGYNWKFHVDVEARRAKQIEIAERVIIEMEQVIVAESIQKDQTDKIQKETGEFDSTSCNSEKNDYDILKKMQEGNMNSIYVSCLGDDLGCNSSNYVNDSKTKDECVDGYTYIVRRTPKLRPIDARTAGRGISVTSKGKQWRKKTSNPTKARK